MPLLQIFDETSNIDVRSYLRIPTRFSGSIAKFFNFVEKAFRLLIRTILLPHVFNLFFLYSVSNFIRVIVLTLKVRLIPNGYFTSPLKKAKEEKLKSKNKKGQNTNAKEKNTSKKDLRSDFDKEIDHMFEPARTPYQLVVRTWILSDYGYDRFLLHAPVCLYELFTGRKVYKYVYHPQIKKSINLREKSPDIEEEEDDYADEVFKNIDDFDLKPYHLSHESIRKLREKTGRDELVSTNAELKSPLIPQDILFENPELLTKKNSPIKKRGYYSTRQSPPNSYDPFVSEKFTSTSENSVFKAPNSQDQKVLSSVNARKAVTVETKLSPSQLSVTSLENLNIDEKASSLTPEAPEAKELSFEGTITPAKSHGIKIRLSKHKLDSTSPSRLKISRRKKVQPHHNDSETQETSQPVDYDDVREAIKKSLACPTFDDGSFGPVVVRLAWHACATYDKNTGEGGSNGATMRFPPELTDDGNTGLHTALHLMEVIKQRFPAITYADLWTLGAVVAIEEMCGPKIEWKPGRIDCSDQSKIPANGRLPLGSKDRHHIRDVFQNHLGFNDQETVVLIGGGHSLGRCHRKYSGWEGKWTENPIHFSNRFFVVLLELEWEWDAVPATGSMQYFNRENDLMMLRTDMELIKDPEFKKWVEIYASDNEKFCKDFADAFAKLLELGVPRS